MALSNLTKTPFSDTSGGLVTSFAFASVNVAAGKLITCVVKFEGTTAIDSITDGGSNALAAAVNANDTPNGRAQQVSVWEKLVSSANATAVFTVTFTPANSAQFLVAELYVSDYAGTVVRTDQVGTVPNASNTAIATASINAGGAAFGGASEFTGTTTTPGAGWTEDQDVAGAGGHMFSRYDTPGGTYTLNATLATAAFWVAAVASYSEVGGALVEDGPEWYPMEPQTNPLTISVW